MSAVVSKNLYALLGNDEEDSDTPKAPVKTVEKSSTHTTKRNAGDEGPKGHAPAGGARRGGPGGNEGAFRDRNAGSERNRSKPTDEAGGRGGRGGGRGRGGRGARYPRERDDRHTKGAPSGSEKQAAQSWGATEGEAELKDEQAGEDQAQKEQREAVAEDTAAEENEPPVEEDKSISYADYLAQQAEKKLALDNELKVRQPNEGSKLKKEWAAAKPLVKDEDEDFIAGSGGKAKRERERKVKQVVDIDQRFVEQDRSRGGGGRGGPRGGARGDFRGRGRGEGRGRGDFRGGRGGRGDGPRGGGASQPINTNDPSAFPSLGS